MSCSEQAIWRITKDYPCCMLCSRTSLKTPLPGELPGREVTRGLGKIPSKGSGWKVYLGPAAYQRAISARGTGKRTMARRGWSRQCGRRWRHSHAWTGSALVRDFSSLDDRAGRQARSTHAGNCARCVCFPHCNLSRSGVRSPCLYPGRYPRFQLDDDGT